MFAAHRYMDNTTQPKATGPRIDLWPKGQTPMFDPSIDQLEPAIFPYLLPDKKAGAVIVCAGGAYVRKAIHEAEPVALRFNELGFHAFVINYRVYPYLYPCALLDLQRAVRTVRLHAEEWNILPDKIAVLGFSAGGHLVTTIMTHFDYGNPDADDPIERVSCRPDAALPCYAVMSLNEFTHVGSRENLIGPEKNFPLMNELSAHLNIRPDTPPAFLFHTAEDGSVPAQNSLLLGRALCDHNIPCAVHIYPYGSHGNGLCMGDEFHPKLEQAQYWSEEAGRFLTELGF